MFFAFLALLVVAVFGDDWTTFREWQDTFGRVYGSAEQEGGRFAIFQSNLRYYEKRTLEEKEALNGHPDSAVFGPDEFSDLNVTEWRAAHGIGRGGLGSGVSPHGQCNFEKSKGDLTPDEVAKIIKDNGPAIDWREHGAVTAVKNQGSYGTCGYFSTIAVMEGINVMQGKNKLVSLSEQENIDCCTSKDGCHGWPGQELDWYSDNKFMASTDKSYPYKGKTGSCQRSKATQTTATNHGKICVGNGAGGNQDANFAHLIKYGPAVWMIGCGPLQGYRSGILSGHGRSPGTFPEYTGIDHATTLVGAGESSGTKYWIVKNSWGASFGEKGYYRVKRDGSPPELACPGGLFGTF